MVRIVAAECLSQDNVPPTKANTKWQRKLSNTLRLRLFLEDGQTEDLTWSCLAAGQNRIVYESHVRPMVSGTRTLPPPPPDLQFLCITEIG